MPATFYVPGCQQKGFLGSPWGEDSGYMQFVDTKERSLQPIVGGEISLFAAF